VHIPGPYSDDTWQWLPVAQKEVDAMDANRFPRVVWDIGVVFALSLACAGFVGVLLQSAGVH
jgi:hypothetical protein